MELKEIYATRINRFVKEVLKERFGDGRHFMSEIADGIIFSVRFEVDWRGKRIEMFFFTEDNADKNAVAVIVDFLHKRDEAAGKNCSYRQWNPKWFSYALTDKAQALETWYEEHKYWPGRKVDFLSSH